MPIPGQFATFDNHEKRFMLVTCCLNDNFGCHNQNVGWSDTITLLVIQIHLCLKFEVTIKMV